MLHHHERVFPSSRNIEHLNYVLMPQTFHQPQLARDLKKKQNRQPCKQCEERLREKLIKLATFQRFPVRVGSCECA